MSNQIILIVTHGNPSTNKMLLKSIQQKGLDTKFAMVVNYKPDDSNTEKEKYNLELLALNSAKLSEEQQLLKGFLPDKNQTFYMEDVAEKFFDSLKEVMPDLKQTNETSTFTFHLFVEVNLTSVGGEDITHDFHEAVHCFGKKFKELAGRCSNRYCVYGYSQTESAREGAIKYFNCDLVNNLKLDIGIDHFVVDIKDNLCKHILLDSPEEYANTQDNQDVAPKIVDQVIKNDSTVNPESSTLLTESKNVNTQSLKKNNKHSFFKCNLTNKHAKVHPETPSNLVKNSDSEEPNNDSESNHDCCRIS